MFLAQANRRTGCLLIATLLISSLPHVGCGGSSSGGDTSAGDTTGVQSFSTLTLLEQYSDAGDDIDSPLAGLAPPPIRVIAVNSDTLPAGVVDRQIVFTLSEDLDELVVADEQNYDVVASETLTFQGSIVTCFNVHRDSLDRLVLSVGLLDDIDNLPSWDFESTFEQYRDSNSDELIDSNELETSIGLTTSSVLLSVDEGDGWIAALDVIQKRVHAVVDTDADELVDSLNSSAFVDVGASNTALGGKTIRSLWTDDGPSPVHKLVLTDRFFNSGLDSYAEVTHFNVSDTDGDHEADSTTTMDFDLSQKPSVLNPLIVGLNNLYVVAGPGSLVEARDDTGALLGSVNLPAQDRSGEISLVRSLVVGDLIDLHDVTEGAILEEIPVGIDARPSIASVDATTLSASAATTISFTGDLFASTYTAYVEFPDFSRVPCTYTFVSAQEIEVIIPILSTHIAGMAEPPKFVSVYVADPNGNRANRSSVELEIE